MAKNTPKYLQESEKRLAVMTIQQLIDEVDYCATQTDYDGELHGEDLAYYEQAKQILPERVVVLESERYELIEAGKQILFVLEEFDSAFSCGDEANHYRQLAINDLEAAITKAEPTAR